MLTSYADLARKLDTPEKKYHAQFKDVFDGFRGLMKHPEPNQRPIGSRTDKWPRLASSTRPRIALGSRAGRDAKEGSEKRHRTRES